MVTSPVESQGLSRLRRDHNISLVNVVISRKFSLVPPISAFKPHHSINFKIQKKDVETSPKEEVVNFIYEK